MAKLRTTKDLLNKFNNNLNIQTFCIFVKKYKILAGKCDSFYCKHYNCHHNLTAETFVLKTIHFYTSYFYLKKIMGQKYLKCFIMIPKI